MLVKGEELSQELIDESISAILDGAQDSNSGPGTAEENREVIANEFDESQSSMKSLPRTSVSPARITTLITCSMNQHQQFPCLTSIGSKSWSSTRRMMMTLLNLYSKIHHHSELMDESHQLPLPQQR